MFGCCVAGRLLQTNLQQIDDTHALFELPNASTINHVCVFVLGTVPFPEGYGAAVHFHWPGKGFQLLGMRLTEFLPRISNDKPSAIFRLRGSFSSTSTYRAFDPNLSMNDSGDVAAILGLSIEPVHAIESQLAALPYALTKSGNDLSINPTLLAEKIVKNLFNYVSGFTGGGAMTPELAVPMGLIARWYENFTGKVRNSGLGFLERDE
ncbi:DUF775-domain-containing protein [Guyanagaster necrorhizus]|uniref:DUF775-domain-containing protein n=1 Tax=Guyanagaster necrorhizus TaxID=856835 RepID=A0A9P7W3Z1_9AGAR|nr:DUF775-domain-containing protein [Guyanagaster necrorhizus MCA 3950]KAG7451545.1 DUF775-domain-containing protein [Guyanagaster necrorhizus MCA 3950]